MLVLDKKIHANNDGHIHNMDLGSNNVHLDVDESINDDDDDDDYDDDGTKYANSLLWYL